MEFLQYLTMALPLVMLVGFIGYHIKTYIQRTIQAEIISLNRRLEDVYYQIERTTTGINEDRRMLKELYEQDVELLEKLLKTAKKSKKDFKTINQKVINNEEALNDLGKRTKMLMEI